jgi:hypothetical protein
VAEPEVVAELLESLGRPVEEALAEIAARAAARPHALRRDRRGADPEPTR